MSIKENDRVKITCGIYDGKVGTVKGVYSLIDTAVVDFDDCVGKVSLSCLVKIESQENQGPKSEIPEGAKQITKIEFFNALNEITDPEEIFSDKSVNPVVALTEGLAIIAFGHTLSEILFEDQDVAIVTEDDLVSAVWEACNPMKMSEKIRKSHSAYECIVVSLSVITRLEKIVPALFGGSND